MSGRGRPAPAEDCGALPAAAALKRIAADTKAPRSAQVSAAVALLDRGWGRPHQSLDVAVNRSLEDMSHAELLAIANGVDDQKLIAATSAN